MALLRGAGTARLWLCSSQQHPQVQSRLLSTPLPYPTAIEHPGCTRAILRSGSLRRRPPPSRFSSRLRCWPLRSRNWLCVVSWLVKPSSHLRQQTHGTCRETVSHVFSNSKTGVLRRSWIFVENIYPTLHTVSHRTSKAKPPPRAPPCTWGTATGGAPRQARGRERRLIHYRPSILVTAHPESTELIAHVPELHAWIL